MSTPFSVPSTDAVLFLNGHDPQPANPWFFLTLAQAEETKASLVAADIVPASATIHESAFALGPVMYGKDGRAVWALSWKEKDESGEAILWVPWDIQLGLLYWRWQELKASTQAGVEPGRWRKTAGGSITRY